MKSKLQICWPQLYWKHQVLLCCCFLSRSLGCICVLLLFQLGMGNPKFPLSFTVYSPLSIIKVKSVKTISWYFNSLMKSLLILLEKELVGVCWLWSDSYFYISNENKAEIPDFSDSLPYFEVLVDQGNRRRTKNKLTARCSVIILSPNLWYFISCNTWSPLFGPCSACIIFPISIWFSMCFLYCILVFWKRKYWVMLVDNKKEIGFLVPTWSKQDHVYKTEESTRQGEVSFNFETLLTTAKLVSSTGGS